MVAVTTNCLVNPAAKVTVAGVTAMLLISVAGFLSTVTTVVDWKVPFLAVTTTVPAVAYFGMVTLPSASTTARSALLLKYTVPSILPVTSFV
ncbi:hypothetical protein D3C73_952450 [compost metagenome]